jgi:hypothetical protein
MYHLKAENLYVINTTVFANKTSDTNLMAHCKEKNGWLLARKPTFTAHSHQKQQRALWHMNSANRYFRPLESQRAVSLHGIAGPRQ